MIIPTRALLLRKVEYRESDLVVTLWSEVLGKVTALARAARRSRTRFSGSIEALHTLHVELSSSREGQRFVLESARLSRPRLLLSSDLDRMSAAARALGWVRKVARDGVPEPEVDHALHECLDRLDDPSSGTDSNSVLAVAGLKLLHAFGWGLELERCVSCGTPCPLERSAYVSPVRGGIVCSACGGGEILLEPERRRALASALVEPSLSIGRQDGEVALRIVEQALLSHADVASGT